MNIFGKLHISGRHKKKFSNKGKERDMNMYELRSLKCLHAETP